jgi:hypothetical protein
LYSVELDGMQSSQNPWSVRGGDLRAVEQAQAEEARKAQERRQQEDEKIAEKRRDQANKAKKAEVARAEPARVGVEPARPGAA